MAEIAFSGQLNYTGQYHPWISCYSSTQLKIDAEWSLKFLYKAKSGDNLLEIRRNSTSKEVLVSGTFELMNESKCVLQQKFVHLFEAGVAFILITVKPIQINIRRYSITGSLKFPASESNGEDSKVVQFKSLFHLSDDLEHLLDPELAYFSDVNINCGSVSFSGHKNILSARSDVFAAMFATQMKENTNNIVKITDLNPAALKTMLTYIYTGKTGELSVQSARGLLFAADKYQLQDLKRVCSDYLKSFLSAETVLRTLVLGYLHDENLKVSAMDFICHSIEEFEVMEETEEWKTLRKKNPALTIDVLTRLVKSRPKAITSELTFE